MSIATRRSDRLARASGIAAALWGTLLLTKGREVWVLADGRDPSGPDEAALRFLGARHLLQGVVQTAAPSRFQRLYVGVDLTHAVSMGWLAAVDERRRRMGLVSGGAALAAAALTLAAQRQD
ncbi:MAG: hypothetical protein ABJA74_02300 [Lapillicoccus sp.]